MLLRANGVSKSFGADVVLSRAELVIDRREKVALVGRNGTGKTTLLRIITGETEPDTGSVHLSRGAKVAMMRQESPVSHERTVLEEAQSGIEQKLSLKKRLAELEARMESGATDEDLEEYALLHEHFEEGEGYSMEHDVRSVLGRMGFSEDDYARPTSELSGGQKTRLSLARLLLEEPDLLILDEPTNHLDLKATEWLESWIRQYHGAVLIVSHDREFLANTVGRVVEIRGHTTEDFPGGFEKYLVLREERDAELRRRAEKEEEQIAKLDEYVRRFMNSQRTAQARGRLKQMEKLVANKTNAPRNERGMGASLKSGKRSGDIVADCQSLVFGYDGVGINPTLTWTVRWGERWGVIGDNGAGKSTLVKTLVGDLRPVSGTARLGSSVELGYFAQDARFSDVDLSPLQFVSYECGLEAPAARDLLGRFLLEGDDVFRPIRTLSGGEKNKLALAVLCEQSPNLLVLDEPTNHLDIASREALAAALSAYQGTLVLVSHDRWLLKRVTDRTLDVQKGGAVQYFGGYAEYRSRPEAPVTKNGRVAARPTQRPTMTPREVSKTIQRLKVEISEFEWKIAEIENTIADTEGRLASPRDGEDFVALGAQHAREKSELEDAMRKWEEMNDELESLVAQQEGK